MKFGLIPVNVGVGSVDQLVGLAQLAEAQGYESVWTFEHVIVPENYESKYPYDASGKMGAAPDTNFVDPLIALTAVAASTKTIRLGTGVNILSQVNPLYMAKQSASLDFVSNGRFMLGVGIGWLREEFDALGVPFERRGARFDDYIVGLKKIWAGDTVEHQSDFINWSGFQSYPLPVQKPHLPIIMGGSKGKIYERIAKHGNGWYAPMTDADELKAALAELRAVCDANERDFSEIEITAMWPGRGGRDAIGALEEAGVHRVVVPLFALGANPAEGIQKLAEDVIA